MLAPMAALPPPLLQYIVFGLPSEIQRITKAVDGAPSSFTFESLGVKREAAYGVAAVIIDKPSDNDHQWVAASDRTSGWHASLATPFQAAMASAEAAFLASFPNLRAIAHDGIRAAALAAADLSVHWSFRHGSTGGSGGCDPTSSVAVAE